MSEHPRSQVAQILADQESDEMSRGRARGEVNLGLHRNESINPFFLKQDNSMSALGCLVRLAEMQGVCVYVCVNDNEGNGRMVSVKAPVISHQSYFAWLTGANGPRPHWRRGY